MKRLGYIIGLASLFAWLALASVVPAQAQSASKGAVRLVKSDGDSVILEVKTPDLNIQTLSYDSGAFSDIKIADWGHTDEVGKPQLPATSAMVAVPQGATVSVKILNDDKKTQALELPPVPSPRSRVRFDPLSVPDNTLPSFAGFDYSPDGGVYGANKQYPAQVVQMTDPELWRSQRYVTVRIRPVQYNGATRELTVHTRVRVELTFSGGGAESAGESVNEGQFESILKASIINYSDAKSWRTRATAARRTVAPEASATSANPTYKITVNTDGIYRVDCSALAGAGLPTETAALDSYSLMNRGNEVAILVRDDNSNNFCDDGDYFLFWGVNPKTIFTDTNVYWLTYGGAAGKRMATITGTGNGDAVTSTMATVRIEENKSFFTQMPSGERDDHWFAFPIPYAIDYDRNGDPASIDYTFTDNAIIPSGTATMRVNVGGISTGMHHSYVSINGKEVYDEQWSGAGVRLMTFAFDASLLQPGQNTLRYGDTLPFATPNSVVPDYYEIDYPRALTADNDTLRIKQDAAGTWTYTLTGFSVNPEIFDITDHDNVAQIQASPEFTVNDATPREYYAMTDAQFKTPLEIVQDAPSDLRDTNNQADYILIAPSSLMSALQPLIQLRESQMSVKVVDIQDVYDEFNNGLLDPEAIRNFLQYAYANWQDPKPTYVLLGGGGSYNYKNFGFSVENTYIPAYLKNVDPWIGLTASDHRLVNFEPGSPLPSMAIGRLPATDTATVTAEQEMTAMVDKIVYYETGNLPNDGWRTRITFLADNSYRDNGSADEAGNFWALSDEVAGSGYYVPDGQTAQRIYFNPCPSSFPSCDLDPATYPPYDTATGADTATDARTALLAAINDGRLIVNYIGHSAVSIWGAESYFKSSDAATLANANKYPMMLPMTCYDGYFQEPAFLSVSEAMLIQPNGGAIASWAPTGLGVAHGHDFLDRGFFEAVFQLGIPQIGLAAMHGKQVLLNDSGNDLDLIDTFNILGDPATKLAVDLRAPPPNPCAVKPTKANLLTESRTYKKTRVWLKWAATACTDKYKVTVRMDGPTGQVVQRAKVKGTELQTIVLPRGHTYYWRVKGCNEMGCQKSDWGTFSIKK